MAPRATSGVFVLNGFLFASWVSRIPTVRTDLGIGPATIGTILLVGKLGSVVALPLAEHVGYRDALLVILVPLAVSLLVTRVAAPPAAPPSAAPITDSSPPDPSTPAVRDAT